MFATGIVDLIFGALKTAGAQEGNGFCTTFNILNVH